jgi:hypothetical protein
MWYRTLLCRQGDISASVDMHDSRLGTVVSGAPLAEMINHHLVAICGRDVVNQSLDIFREWR